VVLSAGLSSSAGFVVVTGFVVITVVVGGAVLTEEYAKNIGADKYAKDAMETVRFAEKVFNNK